MLCKSDNLDYLTMKASEELERYPLFEGLTNLEACDLTQLNGLTELPYVISN